MLRVGTLLHGYCGGAFGRDSYMLKRVEALGADWIIVRAELGGLPQFANMQPEELERYTKPDGEWPSCCETCSQEYNKRWEAR